MTNRSTAAVLNAVLWGSGYIYSRRGANGIFAVFAHLAVYAWSYLTGIDGWPFWAPILIPGTLYFAIDGYRHAFPGRLGKGEDSSRKETTPAKRKGFCVECGRPIPGGAKFCPECGASQVGSGGS